ncbi:MAG: neutral/alkaline non-lysosomal ceramidase N-terminal domain-containing protein [Candidatus Hydrogenedentes bacterium]|nr:neutral/alkaline non-lysosomal ceramidase N-terminal domain-containing protein [Candidatus Hydrogenedentota bacterium]
MNRGIALILLVALSRAAFAFEAGAGKAEITPPLGTPLNGYFDRLGRGATRVHDPVWARSLYLDDGETKVFLINTDLCVLNRELRNRVLELAPNVVPREHIILTATHNHSAQGATIRPLLFRSISGRFMPEVLELTARGIVASMQAAYDARKRAAIGYTTTTQEGLSANRRHDGGVTDPQIGVLRVDDADGNPIAIAGNFAAHPTTVPDEDALAVSADYPGFFYQELERLSGAGCVALFFNGAEGNQRCGNPENKDGWARTESVGRLLATRVKEAANGIKCAEAKLQVRYAAPDLPLTIADRLLPHSTILHTLEIGDLLIIFFPGEPCVEIGLELRSRALARGYAAQFTVGLSDDHLLYFAPYVCYSHLEYETGMSFYGPFIEEWFYREFEKLMTRGNPETDRAAPEANTELLEKLRIIRFSGTSYEIGFQRGQVFREDLRKAYQEWVLAPVASRELVPNAGLWRLAPSFIDLSPLALPRLAVGMRPMLAGLSEDVVREIDGVAVGSSLPFDAVWLLQCLGTSAAPYDLADLYRAPYCTMFAAVGDRAGADDVLVGRNFDWKGDESVVIIEHCPARGHRFIQIGFPWSVGVFSGMNNAGVVLCAERVETLGRPGADGPPLELILRDVLQSADTSQDAIASLQALLHVQGYHVLVAGPRDTEARVLEFGPTIAVREPIEGLLLGTDPESPSADEAAQTRYGRLRRLLKEERIIAAAEIETFLRDREAGQQGQACILNDQTRCSVIFEPKNRRVRVAFPEEPGRLGSFAQLSLAEDKS